VTWTVELGKPWDKQADAKFLIFVLSRQTLPMRWLLPLLSWVTFASISAGSS
jgi:hypothetical protein